MKTNRALEHCALTLMVLPLLLLGSGCNKSRAQPNIKSNAKVEELFKPKLEAIRQAGYPATLAEWNDWYTTPPAADNAASLYQQAFDALAPDDANSPSFLARNRYALVLLHQVAPGKECRYPVDLNQGFYALLPHLLKVRKCAQLLSQEAASLARKLETEAASQSIVEGLRVARSLEAEPMLISYKMLLTSEGIMQTGVETILNRQAFSSAQLTQLQTAFADAENGVALTRALAGERCQGVAFFQLPPPEQEKMFATSVIANRSTNAEVFRSGSDLKPDLDFYLDRMEECLTVRGAALSEKSGGHESMERPGERRQSQGLSSFWIPPAVARARVRARGGMRRALASRTGRAGGGAFPRRAPERAA